MHFDELSIESAFGQLMGKLSNRGTAYDAETFREGDVEDLAEAVKMIADAFEKRAKAIGVLRHDHTPNGLPEDRILGAILSLRESAKKMKQHCKYDFLSWTIIGALVGAIAAMLEILEKKTGI